jgi:hypothetical protein
VPRPPVRLSFAGRGLVERMRSTAFALLGLTTAVALGLVALVSHQSWPYLPAAPIPAYEAKSGALDSAVPLVGLPGHRGDSDVAVGARTHGTSGPGAGGRRGGAAVSGSRHLPSQPSAGTHPGGVGTGAPPQSPAPAQPPVPAASPAPAPAAQPTPAPSPPSTPSGAPSQPAASAAVASSSPGKGHAYGKQKAVAAPASKPPRSASPQPPPAAAPPAAKAPPAPPSAAEYAPGNGHGHAYGHSK